tara:strand:- start:291 stop:905 length:615 start_codon:yes stop_codon:yes gene_type:complete
MTFAEAHERIDVLLDKHELPWFEPEEKDIFLQFAYAEFVKNRYREFEINEKRREDIRPLIRIIQGAGASVPVPSDMMFALSLKGSFIVVDCGNESLRSLNIRPMQHDDINKVIDDPFNKPVNADPAYVTTQTTFDIRSESAPTEWELVYLKMPISVDGSTNPNNTFETPEYTHEEIVNLSVRKMLMSIEKETYQLQMNEIDKQE